VASLSGPAYWNPAPDAAKVVPELKVPVLYMVGKNDADFVSDVESLYGATKEADKQLNEFPNGLHGTQLLATKAARLVLLDRGVVYVTAHIRGGGEFGEPWREAGRMMNKRNTFTDFIAAGEYLGNAKIAAKDRIVIQGGSAGGRLPSIPATRGTKSMAEATQPP